MATPPASMRRRAAASSAPLRPPAWARRAAAWAEGSPLLAVLVLAAVLQLPFLGLRELWWSDELRHAGVLTELREAGHWWALRLNGQFYPDKPPVYFLLLGGLQAVLGTAPWVMFLGLALTVAAAGAATLRLGLAAGLPARTALLGAVLFLTSAYVVALGHYSRMDFLFAALIAMSWAALMRALEEPARAPRLILGGALWASLAFLVKGPLGIGFPALAFMAEAARRGQLRVMLSPAVWAGAALAAATMGLWALGVHLLGGPGALRVFWESQIVGRATGEAVGGHGGAAGLLRYLWMFPLLLLPWSLAWLIRPAAPRPAWPERGFLLAAIVTALVPLSLLGEKHDYYLLPLLAPASVLIAARLGRFSAPERRRFGILVAALLLIAGAAFLAAPRLLPLFDPEGGSAHVLPALEGLGPAGAVALLAGLALLWLRGRGVAAATGAASAAVVLVALLGVAGPVTALLSPRPIAAEMRPWAEAGHAPAVVHGIGGVFQTALGQRYAELRSEQSARDWLEATERGVVAMEAQEVGTLAGGGWTVVACGAFLGRPWAVLARPAPEGAAVACDGAAGG